MEIDIPAVSGMGEPIHNTGTTSISVIETGNGVILFSYFTNNGRQSHKSVSINLGSDYEVSQIFLKIASEKKPTLRF